jgi:hypothetical protein
MTRDERLQEIWHCYAREHGHMPSKTHEAIDWAVSQGLLSLPRIDPRELLARQMARALRQEYRKDAKGRRYRVNHAVRVNEDDRQGTFWAVMGYAPHDHMEKAFAQRREQVVGDCVQLRIDVDVYNDMDPSHPPVNLELDFTEDVAERLAGPTD